jgi:hypothetical protein
MMSTAPPGAKPTISLMALLGKVCATVRPAAVSSVNAAAARTAWRRLMCRAARKGVNSMMAISVAFRADPKL